MKRFLLKLFVVLSLFFLAFYSAFNEDYKMEYYAVFTVAYGVLLLYMLYEFVKGKREKEQRFGIVFAGVLLLYNIVSLYINVNYLHWYGEQIDNTTAFLVSLFLCRHRESLGENGDSMVIFFLRCAVLSNLCSILYYFLGYVNFLICNNHFYFTRIPGGNYEFRHYWLYSHKSDYAVMLIAFMVVAVRFHDKFKNRIIFRVSMLILLTALLLFHSRTGFLAMGMWLGFLMRMNMDYVLLSYGLGMFLFVVYLVCIYEPEPKREAAI